MKKLLWLGFYLLISLNFFSSQNKHPYKLVAYYTGDSATLAKYDFSRITHLIYSFGKINSEGYFGFSRLRDVQTISQLGALKKKYPHLKTMIALGGWGGCELCSPAFADPVKRQNFIKSTKELLIKYRLDGIDLDWEYPTVEGFPGHPYHLSDRENFTSLISGLRAEMPKHILTFAAGGYTEYLEKAIDWKAVLPMVDFVNVMSYDLVGGFSKQTGHMTGLYSSNEAAESADRAIRYFEKNKLPLNKIVLGAAFYTRSWKNVENINHGLFQPGEFFRFLDYNKAQNIFTKESGYQYYWDEKAQAGYWYNEKDRIFATGDDVHSLKAKSQYVKSKKLGGLMFWELLYDREEDERLLEAIDLNR